MGGISLFLIYMIILSLANSFEHAIEQFWILWYWILILMIGFGVQVGLYIHIKSFMKKNIAIATTGVTTAGGISTGSMVACCAHHFTDILPLLGLSVAALFLVKYQLLFILLGVFSNLIGINIILKLMQKHKIHKKGNILFKINFEKMMYVTITISIIILIIVFLRTI